MFSASISAEEKVKGRKVRKKRCIFWKERERNSVSRRVPNKSGIGARTRFRISFRGVIAYGEEEKSRYEIGGRTYIGVISNLRLSV